MHAWSMALVMQSILHPFIRNPMTDPRGASKSTDHRRIFVDDHFDARKCLDTTTRVVALRRPAFVCCEASSAKRPRDVIEEAFACRSGLPVGPRSACYKGA